MEKHTYTKKFKGEMVFQLSGNNRQNLWDIAELLNIDTSKFNFDDNDDKWKLYDLVEVTYPKADEKTLDKILIQYGYADVT